MRYGNVFIRLVLGVCVVWECAHGADYAPLSRKDQRELKGAAEAIVLASDSGNFVQVREFAPSMLERFRSVMLDPKSVKIRPYYAVIESVYNGAVAEEGISIWRERLNKARSDSAKITVRDRFISYLRSELRDDLAQGQEKVFKSDVIDYISANRTMEGYAFIAKLQNVPEAYKKKVKEEIESEYAKILLELSTSTDIKRLQLFRVNYPELFAGDIEALIGKLLAKKRLALLRAPGGSAYKRYLEETGDNSEALKIKVREKIELALKMYPTQEKWDDYFESFPEMSEEMAGLYEQYLYNRFRKELTIERALKYLEAYPDGERAQVVRVWIDKVQGYGKAQDANANAVAGDNGR